jgi:hypothetical protein
VESKALIVRSSIARKDFRLNYYSKVPVSHVFAAAASVVLSAQFEQKRGGTKAIDTVADNEARHDPSTSNIGGTFLPTRSVWYR